MAALVIGRVSASEARKKNESQGKTEEGEQEKP